MLLGRQLYVGTSFARAQRRPALQHVLGSSALTGVEILLPLADLRLLLEAIEPLHGVHWRDALGGHHRQPRRRVTGRTSSSGAGSSSESGISPQASKKRRNRPRAAPDPSSSIYQGGPPTDNPSAYTGSTGGSGG